MASRRQLHRLLSSPLGSRHPIYSPSHLPSQKSCRRSMEAELGGGRNSRWQRTDSFLASIVAGRSYSSRLILGSSPIAAECARYGRISKSLRSAEDHLPPQPRRSKAGAWRFLTQYFSGKRLGDSANVDRADNNYYEKGEGPRAINKNKDRKKRRASSWLPNPERRWPVQGW